MKQSVWLDVYDYLRKAHEHVHNIRLDLQDNDWPEEAKNAIEAVDSVLYLAEGQIVRIHAKDQD